MYFRQASSDGEAETETAGARISGTVKTGEDTLLVAGRNTGSRDPRQ
jgi:hypothetical protein